MSDSSKFIVSALKFNWSLISILVAFSSVIPFIIGVFKYNKISKSDKPFIYLMGFYFLVEIVTSLLLLYKAENVSTRIMNLFVLIDFIALYLLVSKWINRKCSSYELIILALTFIFWNFENFIFSTISTTNIYFRIIYSFLISIKSIELLNIKISLNKRNIWQDSHFLIASTFLIYYSYKAIYESIYLFCLDTAPNIATNAFKGLIVVNFITYILYAIGILCMNKRVQMSISY